MSIFSTLNANDLAGALSPVAQNLLQTFLNSEAEDEYKAIAAINAMQASWLAEVHNDAQALIAQFTRIADTIEAYKGGVTISPKVGA